MASKVDICNMAILGVGGNPINAVPDGSKKVGFLCDYFWDHCLEELLSEYHWRFAKKWDSLAEIAGYTFTDDTYEYAFQIPSDFIRFSDQENVGPSRIDFARREDALLCNVDEFEIEYIYLIEDTTKYPVWFRSALVTLLSSKIAVPLGSKKAPKIGWDAKYQYDLATAKQRDAFEDKQAEERIRRNTDTTDTWMQARG